MLTILPRDPPAPIEEQGEYEIVLGNSQLTSLLFMATVILALFCSISYLAGRATPPQKITTPAPVADVATPPPAAIAQPAAGPEGPLFAEPAAGAVYLQMGAVEKGVAVVFAEGLRKRGFAAFVGPGPSERIFRVLIGPLPDAQAFVRAKDALDQMGLNTFARKYQQ